jgi:hypothetical protein
MKTEFVDIWDFGDDGKVRRLHQFIDTAAAARLTPAAA